MPSQDRRIARFIIPRRLARTLGAFKNATFSFGAARPGDIEGELNRLDFMEEVKCRGLEVHDFFMLSGSFKKFVINMGGPYQAGRDVITLTMSELYALIEEGERQQFLITRMGLGKLGLSVPLSRNHWSIYLNNRRTAAKRAAAELQYDQFRNRLEPCLSQAMICPVEKLWVQSIDPEWSREDEVGAIKNTIIALHGEDEVAWFGMGKVKSDGLKPISNEYKEAAPHDSRGAMNWNRPKALPAPKPITIARAFRLGPGQFDNFSTDTPHPNLLKRKATPGPSQRDDRPTKSARQSSPRALPTPHRAPRPVLNIVHQRTYRARSVAPSSVTPPRQLISANRRIASGATQTPYTLDQVKAMVPTEHVVNPFYSPRNYIVRCPGAWPESNGFVRALLEGRRYEVKGREEQDEESEEEERSEDLMRGD